MLDAAATIPFVLLGLLVLAALLGLLATLGLLILVAILFFFFFLSSEELELEESLEESEPSSARSDSLPASASTSAAGAWCEDEPPSNSGAAAWLMDTLDPRVARTWSRIFSSTVLWSRLSIGTRNTSPKTG